MAKNQHNQSIVGVLKSIHTRIQEGHGGEARSDFLRFLRDQFDLNTHRIHLAEVASLCRRLGEYERAIRLVRPLIDSEQSQRTTATPDEQAQYAACLMSMGAVADGFKILERIDAPAPPEAYLFTAFGHMLRNHYDLATEPLRKFIEHPAPSQYQKLVAQTNLIQVLVYQGDTEETDKLLPELLRTTEQGNFKLLHGNLLESSVHQEFWRGNIAQAERRLAQAQKLHQQSGELRRFYIKQWRAILDLKQGGATPANQKRLKRVQQEARELAVFGIIRECDIALAHVTQDERLWQHLLFGVPPGSQLERIQRLSGIELSVHSKYTWVPQQTPLHEAQIIIELSTGKTLPHGPSLKVGQVLHRLLNIFTNDFYRPLRVGEIHEALFPDKFYHPRASPLAVRQALFRLRRWFDDHELPFEIQESQGTYRLVGHSNGGLLLHAASRLTLSPERFAALCLVKKLQESGELSPRKDIQTQEAAKALGVSLATARRQLKTATEAGYLHRQGAGRSTRYCLPK
ncbi:MAG: DeoR family transcriptional regulator [Deltaproteobacteria bacterium]|nr:DeoR family transcriptional regulator [Deltaproteobacteria bacterium]MBT6489529.1 DeoR family transcriptional regulator [Deltaproteobacteria bacterium]